MELTALKKAIQRVYKEQWDLHVFEDEAEPSYVIYSNEAIEILEQLEIDILQEIEETTNKDIYKIE